jgi:hypothetical protein
MADRLLQRPTEIFDAVPELWDDVTFEGSQNVFLTGTEGLQ